MDIVTYDWETYYNKDYSLKKMSPIEYILDPRFQVTGLAVKRFKQPSFWVHGQDVEEFFREEPENVLAVSHNALFDMCICYYRFGWVPKVMVDTLGVSRALLQAFLRSLSLASVAKHLGLGAKGGALANVINMRREDIQAHPKLYADFMEYGKNDADLCFGIFEKLVMSGKFPMSEIAIMNSVLRCAVVPQFKLDINALNESLVEIQQSKEDLLTRSMLLGSDIDKLMSNDKFAELLQQFGVNPPTKISAKTGKEAWAFAKSDKAFLDLLEHEDPNVQALVAARFGHKSTIEETRHERFIRIGQLQWPATKVTSGGTLGLIPMPLRYSGAHTHRLSGDWKMNVQNMGRKSKLRKSLTAPEGYKVVAGDESQIEARFVVTLSGQEDVRQQFDRGEDVYSLFATELFGFPVTKANQIERFIGKQCILGLGFGLGHDKFGKSIPILSQNQIGKRIDMEPEEAERTVNIYRATNFEVVRTWKLLNTMGINALITGQEWQWGPVLFKKDEIVLPNGLSLFYHNIRRQEGGKFGSEVVFEYGPFTKRCYGGMLLENIAQALARIVTMEAAIRVEKRLAKAGIKLALQVHDELVFVVPDRFVQVVRGILEQELRRRPKWLPLLPLDCETGVGQDYGSAK